MGVTSVSTAETVPEREGGRVVGGEFLMMIVMERSTAIERQKLKRVHVGKVIAAVNFSGLKHAHEEPGPEEEEMIEEEDHRNEEANTESESLHGVSILGGKSERDIVLVMKFVPDTVDRLVMQSAVSPVVPAILHQQSAEELRQEVPHRGHRVIVIRQVNMDRLQHIVHENRKWEIDGDLGPSDFLDANPLLGQ